ARYPSLYTTVPQCFLNFLIANTDTSRDSDYDYVYINLQKRSDGYKSGYVSNERDYEHTRSVELHKIEQTTPRVAVITLPADNSDFFLKGFDKHHGQILIENREDKDFETCDDLFKEIVDSIYNNHHDIFISDEVKTKLFGGTYKEHIKKGIGKAYGKTLSEIVFAGDEINPEQKISKSQRQAILFHFFKHHFTDQIIHTLNPKCYNISCKDAIDRAGVHNLWNILSQHIEHDVPLSVGEFEKLLNLPAILVKDRPINDHINLVANALGHYFYHLPEDKQRLIPWAPTWLKLHSVYHDKAEIAYTWQHKGEKSLKLFQKLHPSYFSDLYCAVSEGNIDHVVDIIETCKTPKSLSIWDGPKKSDTLLLAAARNGHFTIFKILMDFHDTKKGYFEGIRSQPPEGQATALNHLLRHLLHNDIDHETVFGEEREGLTSNLVLKCVCP